MYYESELKSRTWNRGRAPYSTLEGSVRMSEIRQSRVALVVVKLKVRGKPYFLMRKNRAWGDVTFIGGHTKDRESETLRRAAYRELLEEVPPLRSARGLKIEPLTPQLPHGPVESLSAKTTVMYDLQFFLVRFRQTPDKLIASLGPRSLNVLVRQSDLLEPNRHKIASLVHLLKDSYEGGLPAIPYSWPEDLEAVHQRVAQEALAFH